MQYTYKQLKRILDNMSEEELEQTATVYVGPMDEYMPVCKTGFTSETDILDDGHLVLGV